MLSTEKRNEMSKNLDKMSTSEIVALFCRENYNAVRAVEAASDETVHAIDEISARMAKGGRLIYVGAGTSGRLGVIDAAECPPTFGVSYDTVIGIIAGGEKSLTRASENCEDSFEAGKNDILAKNPTENDSVIGISAAGGAAYVLGALECAKEVGALTVSLSSNRDTPIERAADIAICTETGAEILTGSTRLKAGTAQKLVLNMISTSVMVKTGKVRENLMINLAPSNIKLRARMISIVCELIGCDAAEAEERLDRNAWNINRAVDGEQKSNK